MDSPGETSFLSLCIITCKTLHLLTMFINVKFPQASPDPPISLASHHSLSHLLSHRLASSPTSQLYTFLMTVRHYFFSDSYPTVLLNPCKCQLFISALIIDLSILFKKIKVSHPCRNVGENKSSCKPLYLLALPSSHWPKLSKHILLFFILLNLGLSSVNFIWYPFQMYKFHLTH